MRFEFDADKSAGNKDKHGINFVEAQALWDDWDLLEIPAKTVEDVEALLPWNLRIPDLSGDKTA